MTDGHSSNDIEFYMLTRDKNGKTASPFHFYRELTCNARVFHVVIVWPSF